MWWTGRAIRSFVFLKGHRFQGSRALGMVLSLCVSKVHGCWAHLLMEKVGAAGQAG